MTTTNQPPPPSPQPAAEAQPRAPVDLDRVIGQRLRHMRIEAGISQQSLGSLCGLSFQQIQKYERGTNRISASRLQQLAHVLDVPITEFLSGAVIGGDERAFRSTLVSRLTRAADRLDLKALDHLTALAERLPTSDRAA